MKKRMRFKERSLPAETDAKTIGANIRDLRRRANLSQGELANRLGIRQGPLCNVENGKHFPSTPLLLKIVATLNVNVNDILQSQVPFVLHEAQGSYKVRNEDAALYCVDSIAPCTPRYMSFHPSSIQASHPDAALSRTIEILAADYLALEDLCSVQRCATVPLDLPGIAYHNATRRAAQMRHWFGISNAVVFDYLELFENHGLRVIFLRMPKEHSSLSYYDAINRNAFFFINSGMTPEKQTFALAYELGLIMQQADICREINIHHPAAVSRDKAARLFAANFLMPAEVVCTTVQQIGITPTQWDWRTLLRLKHRFGISAETFNYRLLELNLITPELQQSLRQQISAYYEKHRCTEPGLSRRILAPNGRIGDLLHIALQRGHKEAQEISARLKQIKVILP